MSFTLRNRFCSVSRYLAGKNNKCQFNTMGYNLKAKKTKTPWDYLRASASKRHNMYFWSVSWFGSVSHALLPCYSRAPIKDRPSQYNKNCRGATADYWYANRIDQLNKKKHNSVKCKQCDFTLEITTPQHMPHYQCAYYYSVTFLSSVTSSTKVLFKIPGIKNGIGTKNLNKNL